MYIRRKPKWDEENTIKTTIQENFLNVIEKI